MTKSNYNQFINERNSWRIKLEHFQQENVLLKYRLSKIVDDNEGHHFLQVAEYFQNELLIIDVILEKLFKKLDEFAVYEREGKNVTKQKIITEHNELKKSFAQFEKKFLKLSKEFNKKMLETFNL